MKELFSSAYNYTAKLYQLLAQTEVTLLLRAALCCALTALIKHLLLNKTKIDIAHTFDPTALLPFVLGTIAVAVEKLCVGGFGYDTALTVVRDGVLTGAVSTTLYKMYAAVDSKSLKQLKKDDLFTVVYEALLYYTDAKEELLAGKLRLDDLIGQAQTLCASARKLFSQCDATERKAELSKLMEGVFDKGVIETLSPVLCKAIEKIVCK